jgi:protein TonB
MSGHLNRGRDLAGWLGASAVTAVLFAGAAGAALRAMPDAVGKGQVEAVALNLSVGVVPLSAVVPSKPPRVEGMVDPEALDAPRAEMVPDLPVAVPTPMALPQPDLPAPVLALPQAEAPPMLAAAPPPPPPEDPPLELAESPHPLARPDRSETKTRQAETSPATPQTAEEPDPAPSQPVRTAQPAGSDQAARPAQDRRVAGGHSAAQYSYQVMRQIARLRRKTAPERGVVTVGFEIGADGGLRRVVVVSSSGSAALDQVAVDHIHRAGPFPPPPQGAAQRFAFEFMGK